MKDEVLFEITKDKLETGLRGFPVGYCITSTVDPVKGLSYMGHPVAELAFWRPEEVIYLIMKKKRGSVAEVKEYFAKLNDHAALKSETIDAILRQPQNNQPKKQKTTALLI